MRRALRLILGAHRGGAVAAALLLPVAAAYASPGLTAWGWHGQVGRFDVYADAAPGPALTAEIGRAERLLAASPINDPNARPRLYLTDGGWRWRIYAIGQTQSFGITRPLIGDTFLNRSDIAHDAVFARGYRRTLSGTIAHETTHVMQRRRLGLVRYARLPAWIREGYADHVAQESTLSDADVARLRAQGRSDPAIFYHDARKRVEALLAGGTGVDRLMAGGAA